MEIILTMHDIDLKLHQLEEKYQFSTEDFLCDAARQARVSPDDFFDWKSLIEHKRGLGQEALTYWENVDAPAECEKNRSSEQLALVA